MSEQWDGRPQNPERDGWHWVRRKGGHAVRPLLWVSEDVRWMGEDHGPSKPGSVSARWEYLGPCLTPAEVEAHKAGRREALEAAARREGIEAAALVAANYQLNNDGCVAAIRTLLEDK